MAIVRRDEKRLVAVVSKPALCLFQNMEYSCIHCAARFGSLDRDETDAARTRIDFASQTLDEWYARTTGELERGFDARRP